VSISSSFNFDPWGMPPEPVRRITVAEYHQMIDVGMITEDDRCEFVEGWLLPKMTRNPPHDFVIGELNRILGALSVDDWVVRVQSAISLSDGEPEPDVAICIGPGRRYAARHPSAADTPLVIEVADTTLARDRGIKLRSYARAGIQEYWIVNLVDRQIEVYTHPRAKARPPAYGLPVLLGENDNIRLTIQGKTLLTIAVRDLLP
jgi:Uma2 family endonuclease